MPGCLKAFLIVAAVLLVLGGGCVAVAVWWWQNNGEEFMAQSQAATAEGREAGRGTDEAGCVALVRERPADATSMNAVMGRAAYLRGCLGRARETPGFCEGVPAETEFRASMEWQGRQCPTGGAECQMVAQTVQQYCGQERPHRTFGDDAVEATPETGAAPDTAAGSF